MKPVITIFETELKDKENLVSQLQSLGKQKGSKGVVEYMPKARKITEVIRVLRENRVLYQIRFETSPN